MQVQQEGWIPQHVLLYDDSTSQLVGCVPLYLKTHSYGEYVFDHSWAHTHQRCGLPYYPKLQSCVPFTPVTGSRLLVKPGQHTAAVTKALAKGLMTLTGVSSAFTSWQPDTIVLPVFRSTCSASMTYRNSCAKESHGVVINHGCDGADQLAVSSLHLTFNTAEEASALSEVGYLQRTGIQYHWENRGYLTFEDFLADLKQSKRKNIRQVCLNCWLPCLLQHLTSLSGAISPRHIQEGISKSA